MNKRPVSEAIDRTATQIRENAKRSGVEISQADARARVAAARERGDRMRENKNR